MAVLLPEFQTNTWLLWDDESKEAILVDASAPSEELLKHILSLQLKVKMIVNTHGHGDHIGGNGFFANALGAPTAIHAADAVMLTNSRKNLSEYMGMPLALDEATIKLNDGDEFTLGKHNIRVLHSPGHTLGGICLLAEKYLISGDTLFEMSVGRTDLPGGNHEA